MGQRADRYLAGQRVKIPYLTEREIEDIAAQTRSRAEADGVSSNFPLNVEAVAEFHLDYELSYTSQLPPGVEGATSWTLRKILVSDAVKNDGRWRFTVAHEIGHIVLHVPLFMAQEQLTPLFASRPVLHQDRKLEIQADMFASSLLMPRAAVIALYQSCHRPEGLITAEELSATFGTSKQAAQIRLETLGLLSKYSPEQRLLL